MVEWITEYAGAESHDNTCLHTHTYMLRVQGVDIQRISEGDGKNYPKAGDTVQMVRSRTGSGPRCMG